MTTTHDEEQHMPMVIEKNRGISLRDIVKAYGGNMRGLIIPVGERLMSDELKNDAKTDEVTVAVDDETEPCGALPTVPHRAIRLPSPEGIAATEADRARQASVHEEVARTLTSIGVTDDEIGQSMDEAFAFVD